MTEIEFNYSIRGKRCAGRWYPRPDRITLFLNNIPNPEVNFDEFISSMAAIELHELGHVRGFRGGCKKCKGDCYYCELNSIVSYYLLKDVWVGAYLEGVAREKNKSEKSWKETQQRN